MNEQFFEELQRLLKLKTNDTLAQHVLTNVKIAFETYDTENIKKVLDIVNSKLDLLFGEESNELILFKNLQNSNDLIPERQKAILKNLR